MDTEKEDREAISEAATHHAASVVQVDEVGNKEAFEHNKRFMSFYAGAMWALQYIKAKAN